ncbi:MAG: phenylalanine--tRNA ligase beta subunit-related protein [Thermomicrobiales bacterium]
MSELLDLAETRARATFGESDLKEHTQFAAWREAFSTAGWSASRFPSSVEALHKRIQRGGELPRINVPVDLANSAVLYYSIPTGTHDIDTFGGEPLAVRRAVGGDHFLTFAEDDDPPDEGEIVYAVGSDVRTRRWVWRQGRNGQVSGDARNIFYPLDGFMDTTYDAVVAAMNYLSEICTSTLGARVFSGLVTADNPTFCVGD